MNIVFVNVIEAKEKFADLLNRVTNGDRILLTRRGKEIAAMVPLEDLKTLQQILDKSDLEDATDALKEARTFGTMSLDQLREKVGL